MLLTDKEKKTDLEEICRALHNIDIEADVYEKGEVFEDIGLMAVYPDESDHAVAAIEQGADPEDYMNTAVSYMFDLDDDEEPFNKYILIYSELHDTYNEIDELTLFRFLADFNQQVVGGHFYPQQDNNGNMKIRYKGTMHSKWGELIDSVAYGEMFIQMIFYVSLLTDALAEIMEAQE